MPAPSADQWLWPSANVEAKTREAATTRIDLYIYSPLPKSIFPKAIEQPLWGNLLNLMSLTEPLHILIRSHRAEIDGPYMSALFDVACQTVRPTWSCAPMAKLSD